MVDKINVVEILNRDIVARTKCSGTLYVTTRDGLTYQAIGWLSNKPGYYAVLDED